MISLRLLGGASLEGPGGALAGPAAQRHRVALLALLAVVHPRSLSREWLMACLWPDRDPSHARNLLNQAVHALRRALGEDAIVSGVTDLRLDAAHIRCDVIAFEAALAAGERRRAAGLYAGPLLEGFSLPNAQEFEHWMAGQRERLRRSFCRVLEELAQEAEDAGDASEAVAWWRRLAAEEPYSAQVTLRLMAALDASGDRAAAIQQARVHSALVQQEFGAEPDAQVAALAEQLRVAPARAETRAAPLSSAGVTLPERREGPSETGQEAIAATARPERSAWRRAVRSRTYIGAAAILVLSLVVAISTLDPWAAGDGEGAQRVGAPPLVSGMDHPREVPLTTELNDTLSANPVAREALLAGIYDFARATQSNPALLQAEFDSLIRRSIAELERAVALEPQWAAAHAWLATSYHWLASSSVRYAPEYYDKSRAAALQALSLDANEHRAHAALAFSLFTWYRDWDGAERAIRRAMDLDPNAYHWHYALFLLGSGRPREAIPHFRKAQESEPLSSSLQYQVALAYACSDQFAEAIAEARKLYARVSPTGRAGILGDSVWFFDFVAHQYALMGADGEAVTIAEKLVARTDTLSNGGLLAFSHARAGRMEIARRIARRMEAHAAAKGRRFGSAQLSAALGDTARAIELLRPFIERRAQLQCLISYRLLRNDPRLRAILDSAGYRDGVPYEPARPIVRAASSP